MIKRKEIGEEGSGRCVCLPCSLPSLPFLERWAVMRWAAPALAAASCPNLCTRSLYEGVTMCDISVEQAKEAPAPREREREREASPSELACREGRLGRAKNVGKRFARRGGGRGRAA